VKAKIKWNGPAVKAANHAAAARGLGKAAEHILGESRKEVPLEEGTLERSGVASVDREHLIAAVAYDTPYAVRQHEELTWQHDEGRNAKYLEGPMNRERDTALQIIAAEIRRDGQ
jgi:hypothetical protein